MVDVYKLKADLRETTGRKVKTLRTKGVVPAVVYGPGTEPKNVSISANDFLKLYRDAGESTLVDLSVGETDSVKVLIQDVQHDPVRDEVIHVDFRQVRMDEKLETDIELEFVGEAPAVKELGGVLVKSMDSLAVRCLPGDLVSEIEVPLGSLVTFEDKIHVKDVVVPTGIEVLDDPNATVALIEEPRSEDEIKRLDEAPTEEGVEKVEVSSEKKIEEGEKGEEKEGAAAEKNE